MIDFVSIRNAIIGGLHTAMDVPVIDGNSTNKKPEYPYISFVITTPFNREFSNPREQTFSDTTQTRKEEITMTVSFNAHSNSFDEAHTTALDAIRFFEFESNLYASGVVVINTLPAENRDVLLVDQRERRVGFDVLFRVESDLTRELTTIDDVDFDVNIE